MQKKINELISAIFHPIFTPIVIIELGLRIGYNDSLFNHYKWFFILFCNTILFPVLILVLYKKNKIISSYLLKDRRERILPLLSSIVFLIIGFYFLIRVNVPVILLWPYSSGIILVFLIVVISLYYKISIHMAGIGAVYGALLFYFILFNAFSSILLLLILLFSVIIGLARISLNAHSMSQLITGFILGIVSILSLFFMM